MAKFRYDCAAGDDAPDDRKVNWLADLPPPPRDVYPLMDRARDCNLWLRWARNPRVLASWKQRYRLSKAGSSAVVYASDSLDDIRECIAEFESEA